MRSLWVGLGTLFVALGALGIALPLLPTTPFLLLAAGCYARGSPTLQRWLLDHPRLGPPLRAWRESGVVPPRAKLLACALLSLSLAYAWACPVGQMPLVARLVATAVLGGVAAFLLSRPSYPPALTVRAPIEE